MTSTHRHVRLALGVVAVILLLIFVTPIRHGVGCAVVLLSEGDVAGLRAQALDAGAWAPLVLAGLMILQAVVAPLPSSPVTYVNGLLFGLWWGGLLSWASALVAAAICFGLSRRLGRPVAQRFVTAHAIEWTDRFFARFGAYAVLLGRLLPVVSFDVVSYGAGLTRMSFMGFMVATAIGMIPGTLLYAYLGRLGGESGTALMWTLLALTGLGLIVLLAGRKVTWHLVASADGAEPGPDTPRRHERDQGLDGRC